MMRELTMLLGAALVCCAQSAAPVPSAKLPANVAVQPNVSYSQHPETVMDIYQPQGSSSGEKRCGVLAIHGGGWVNGSKEAVLDRLVTPWLGRGCVVANVEYRLAKAAPAPAAVQDVLQAAEFLRKNASRWNIDPRRIVAIGTSAGGHLALMAGMTPKSARLGPAGRIAAVINFYGITDVEDQLGGENMRKYAVTWVPEGEGRMELARKVSPMSYIRKNLPPVLTIHGTADETVPYEHGVRLTKHIRDLGGDAEMISVPGAGHGFPPETMNQVYADIFRFLERRGILKDNR